jgi:hypothetical protein
MASPSKDVPGVTSISAIQVIDSFHLISIYQPGYTYAPSISKVYDHVIIISIVTNPKPQSKS